MSFVNSDLHRLSADLTAAGVKANAAVRPVVLKGALNIQTDARDLASGHRALGAYPLSITFDLDADGMGADIGPDKDLPQGALGNLIEYGSTNTPPMPHLDPALDHEAPGFEDAIADAVIGSLL